MTILDNINKCISEEDNQSLLQDPTEDEIKSVVFEINPNSSAGPDGFTSLFFQKTWDITGLDIVLLVKNVFNDEQLPRFFTNSCLVLLPKVEIPQTFLDFRPISLSNVIQKIISKIVNNRLTLILPNIISLNQSGFIKGRSIGENVLLAQEIIHEIKTVNKGGNVIFKIDMNKAYDRIS